MSRALLALASAVALQLVASPGFSGTDPALKQRWEGRWVVIRSEVGSSCDGTYTNNRVKDGRLEKVGAGWEGRFRRLTGYVATYQAGAPPPRTGPAEDRHLGSGELASVDKLQLGGGRVDILVEIAGRVLLSRQHGPFTLLRQASCRVELQIEVPKKELKKATADTLERLLAATVERHESEAAARGSSSWNGRGDEMVPVDYEDTQRRYGAWRNAEIERGLEEATRILLDLGRELSPSRAYLASFVRGVARIEPSLTHQPCEGLVASTFRDFQMELASGEVGSRGNVLLNLTVQNPGGEGSESYTVVNKGAYVDGQRVLYALVMLERLPGCRVDGVAEEGS